MVPCVVRTSEATFYQIRRGQTGSHRQTDGGYDSAAGENDEHGRHGNTTSMPTYRGRHGYQCQQRYRAAARTQALKATFFCCYSYTNWRTQLKS